MDGLDGHQRAAPAAVAVAAAADKYDYGCRKEFTAFGSADGRLQIVRSNVYSGSRYSSAAREPSSPQRRDRSMDPRLPQPSLRGRPAGVSVWCFNDPEMKRRRRVARYKSYAVEGKLKASIRRGFRWIKIRCSELVHRW